VRVEAAFAIAESRHGNALECLVDVWHDTPELSCRKSLLLAISTIRTRETAVFLQEQSLDRRYEATCAEALEGFPADLIEQN
jgi:hypothetical protein